MAKPSIPAIQSIPQMDEEPLPVAKHKLHGWPHFFGLYGAAEQYPEGEEAERQFQALVAEWQARQKQAEAHGQVKDTSVLFKELVAEWEAGKAKADAEAEDLGHVKNSSLLSKAIKAIWIIIGLAVPVVLAWITLFLSPNLYADYVNVERFYTITIWCTFIYFLFAYWDLRRFKAFAMKRETTQ